MPHQGLLQCGNAAEEYATNTEGSAEHSTIVVTTMRQALEYDGLPMSSRQQAYECILTADDTLQGFLLTSH